MAPIADGKACHGRTNTGQSSITHEACALASVCVLHIKRLYISNHLPHLHPAPLVSGPELHPPEKQAVWSTCETCIRRKHSTGYMSCISSSQQFLRGLMLFFCLVASSLSLSTSSRNTGYTCEKFNTLIDLLDSLG